MTQAPSSGPEIKWDGKTWFVTLPVEHGKLLEAKWEPGLTYVIRIREAGTEDWSFGFATPIAGCTFVDLKPDTEYEVQVRAKNAAGEGEPAHLRMRTDPVGAANNIVPFPKR